MESQQFEQLEQNLKEHLDQKLSGLVASLKTVLNSDEVAAYTGLSKSYLYKLTHTAQIPHFKPQGKHIYFNKAEIDQWLQRNPVTPVNADEIEQQAATYVALKNMGRAK